ncbi:MAG: transcriptional repressor [Alphaproteobacteria bacterium]|nr:transcriptional repressor [Alphaproteobacteria bacterium]
MTASPMSFPSHDHDHRSCVASALGAAEAECRRRGARLTDIRRRVLELIWTSHAPVGAYALLEQLGRGAAPPTIYRALDFLLAHGLIHRIETQNAYVGCSHPGQPHAGLFLLCRQCGAVAELAEAATTRAIEQEAAALGFQVDSLTVEAHGLCPGCRRGAGP